MGTHAIIAIQKPDGAIEGIYVHYSGYIGHTGQMLVDYYNSPELAAKLIAGGAISELRESIEGAPGHSFANPVPGQTLFYARDRGERRHIMRGPGWLMFLSHNGGRAEYNYLWDGKQWLVERKDARVPKRYHAEVARAKQ